MLSVLRASPNLFAAMQAPMGLATVNPGPWPSTHLAQQVWEKGLLYAVALDPHGVGTIVDALAGVGISGRDQIVGISQGWKLTGTIKTGNASLPMDHCGTAVSVDVVGGGKCAFLPPPA